MKKSIDDCSAYAAYLKDPIDLKGSTSGGIFYALAKTVLLSGGVVYGASMEEDFTVRHIRVSSLDDIDRIRRSKYTQSRIGNVYSQIKDDLESEQIVLFSGTPCQVAGLKAFLRCDHMNLYTVDIFCHGVPSNRLFREHAKYIEKKEGKKLKEFQFRNKDNGWRPVEVSYRYDGLPEIKYNSTVEDSYFRVFDRYISLRKSCYNCIFRGMQSGADISIGDYWGIEKQHPEFTNDNRGISAVIVKTKKGEKIWKKIRDTLVFIESTPQQIGNYNFLIYRSIGNKVIRDAFYANYIKYRKTHELIDLDEIEKITLESKGKTTIDVLGSYSLRACIYPILVYDYRIIQRIHWTGTTVFSSMSDPLREDLLMTVHLKNEYRQNCIVLDWKKELVNGLSQKDHGKILAIDLLDDTLDMLLLNDGHVITKSEACEDYLSDNNLEIKAVISMTDISENEWQSKCDRLTEIISDTYGFKNTVVVCNYLSEKHGKDDQTVFFDRVDEIREKNRVLRQRYEYLISHMPGCIEIDVGSSDCYTPDNFKYGCKPVYYSGRDYKKAAKAIYGLLGDDEWK